MQVCPCVTENALNTKSEMKWFSAAASWQQPCNYGGQTQQPAAAILQLSTFVSPAHSSSFFPSQISKQNVSKRKRKMCKMKDMHDWTSSCRLFLYFAKDHMTDRKVRSYYNSQRGTLGFLLNQQDRTQRRVTTYSETSHIHSS